MPGTRMPNDTMIASQPFARRALAMTVLVALALSLGACGAQKHKLKTTPTTGTRVPILSRIEAGTKVDDALSSVAVVLPPAEVNTEWAQGGGNAAKSYGQLALGDHPKKLWSANISGSSQLRRLAADADAAGSERLLRLLFGLEDEASPSDNSDGEDPASEDVET